MEHYEEVVELREQIFEHELPRLTEREDIGERQIAACREYADDLVNLFKYLRKARFDGDRALTLIVETMLWRISPALVENGLAAPPALLTSNCTDFEFAPMVNGFLYFLPVRVDLLILKGFVR